MSRHLPHDPSVHRNVHSFAATSLWLPQCPRICRNVSSAAATSRQLLQGPSGCRSTSLSAAIFARLPQCLPGYRNACTTAAMPLRLPQCSLACRNVDPDAAISIRLPQRFSVYRNLVLSSTMSRSVQPLWPQRPTVPSRIAWTSLSASGRPRTSCAACSPRTRSSSPATARPFTKLCTSGSVSRAELEPVTDLENFLGRVNTFRRSEVAAPEASKSE
jgi:hypothetical protein